MSAYEDMYQQGLDRLKVNGKCGKKELRMLKNACENASKLEQEECLFAEKQDNPDNRWTDTQRLKAEQSLIKRWRTFQLDAVRYGWTPLSRREMINRCFSTGDAFTAKREEVADPMEQLLRENQIRMETAQKGSNDENRKTLMDVLAVDRPARFVDEKDLKMMSLNEEIPKENI